MSEKKKDKPKQKLTDETPRIRDENGFVVAGYVPIDELVAEREAQKHNDRGGWEDSTGRSST